MSQFSSSPRPFLIHRLPSRARNASGPLKIATLCAAMCALASACSEPTPKAKNDSPVAVEPSVSAPVSLPSTIVEPAIEPASIAPPAMPAKKLPKLSYGDALSAAGKFTKVGDVEAALEMYGAAIAADGDKVKPHIESARVLIAAKRPGEARAFAASAIERDPNSSYAWNTMGRIDLAEGDLEAAVKAFENATDSDSDNAYAWNNLGLTLMKLGRHDDAAAALEEATSADKPTHYMWNNLGGAYEQLGKADLALAAFRRAEELGSKNATLNIKRLESSPELTESDAEDLEDIGELPDEVDVEVEGLAADSEVVEPVE